MAEAKQAPRGTRDLFPEEAKRFREINDKSFHIAESYGYGELLTPLFEASEVFQKTLGETSDIVGKEMYSFLDRGGDSLTLRPEGTAGIARAFISHGLMQNLPLKYYYYGPMFRYERPQKGRYRQFYQVGVENLGVASPLADVESIALAFDILSEMNLKDHVKLELNTLGDLASRQAYRTALVQYLTPLKEKLSEDSQVRLDKNPLRILDSKEKQDQEVIAHAPQFKDCLTPEAKDFFQQVRNGLIALGIPYQINDRLVRGLDYYCHTVFEFTTELLGAQSAVLAGGRYDGLISMMGGPDTPGVGWASGVDRLALLVEATQKDLSASVSKIVIAVIVADDSASSESLKIAHHLRKKKFQVEMPLSGNMGKKMKRADKIGAKFALILGANEISSNTITIKNLKTGEQSVVANDPILDQILT